MTYMHMNEGIGDRIFRVCAAIVFFFIALKVTSLVISTILAIIGFILLMTGALGYCPFYFLFNINTRVKK